MTANAGDLFLVGHPVLFSLYFPHHLLPPYAGVNILPGSPSQRLRQLFITSAAAIFFSLGVATPRVRFARMSQWLSRLFLISKTFLSAAGFPFALISFTLSAPGTEDSSYPCSTSGSSKLPEIERMTRAFGCTDFRWSFFPFDPSFARTPPVHPHSYPLIFSKFILYLPLDTSILSFVV